MGRSLVGEEHQQGREYSVKSGNSQPVVILNLWLQLFR
jgi:hypothetical protein